jgi:hypothetical protein
VVVACAGTTSSAAFIVSTLTVESTTRRAQLGGHYERQGRAGTVGEEALPVTPACVYCGERDATTMDHIPPRCLFDRQPATLIKVPSCFPCNNGASMDDEYFRTVLSFRHDVDHPDVGPSSNGRSSMDTGLDFR